MRQRMVNCEVSRWESPGTEVKPRNNHIQHDGEDGSFGADLSWIGFTMVRCLPLGGKGYVCIDGAHASKSAKIMYLLDWTGLPIRSPPSLSFVFVVYFIRAHLRGASLGTRIELGYGLIIFLEMAWARQ